MITTPASVPLLGATILLDVWQGGKSVNIPNVTTNRKTRDALIKSVCCRNQERTVRNVQNCQVEALICPCKKCVLRSFEDCVPGLDLVELPLNKTIYRGNGPFGKDMEVLNYDSDNDMPPSTNYDFQHKLCPVSSSCS